MEDGKIRIIDNIGGAGLIKAAASSIKPSRALKKMLSLGKVVSISKDSNPDGLSGPALLVHNYKVSDRNIILTNYKDLGDLLSYLKKRKISNSSIVFSDLGISPGNLEVNIKILRLLKSQNNTIIWIDHHPWEENVVSSVRKLIDFATFGENPSYCATELVFLLLCNYDRTGREIAILAHYSDFPIKSKYDALKKRLSYAIIGALYDDKSKDRNLRKIIRCISNLDYENRQIEEFRMKYVRNNERNTKLLLRNLYKIRAGKYLVGVGFSRRLETNSACATMKDELKTNINVYVAIDSGKSGIRSKDGIDSSKIAKALGGGGHPQASGFSINPSKLKNSNKSEMEKFAKKIGRISDALYG